MATSEQITKVVGTMAAAFPHVNVGKETYDIYAKMLADVPVAELQAAAAQCLASARFFPSIGEIRDKVLELRRLAADDGAPDAGTAWAEVCANARYSSSSFSHPRIAAAAQAIGGMRMLGMASDSDMVAHRARFLEAYRDARGREEQQEALLPGVKAAVAKMQEIAAQQRRLMLGVHDEN